MKPDRPWTAYASSIQPLPEIGGDATEYAVDFQATTTASDGRITLYLGGSLSAGATFDWQPGKLYRMQCNQPVPLSVDVGNVIFDHGAAVGAKKWSMAELRQDGDYYYDRRCWQVVLRLVGQPGLTISQH